MAAIVTAKKGFAQAVQNTFPDVAAAVRVETQGHPYGYGNRARMAIAELPAANGMQQDYHSEKKRWADRNAMNWVHNNARTRWLMNHNTFGYTQPKPVLSQRIFANPSLGNTSDIYSARHDIGARGAGPMDTPVQYRGGILRTAEGQEYYQKLMKARSDQLNLIQSGVPQAADAPLNPNSTYDPNPLGPVIDEQGDKDKIALKDALEVIFVFFETNRDISLITSERLQDILSNINSARDQLFSLAVTFDKYDFNDILEYLETLVGLADSMLNSRSDPNPGKFDAVEERLLHTLEIMLEYTEGMFGFVNSPLAVKQAKSANLIRSLGISGFKPILHREQTGDEGVAPADTAPAAAPAVPPSAPAPPPPPASGPGTPAEPKNLVPPTGSGKKWIQKAVKGMKKNALTEEAERHHMTTEDFAAHVLGHSKDFSVTTRRRAQMFKNMQKRGGAAINPAAQKSATFDVDQRVKFGDRQGAYLGEQIGEMVPEMPVPVPMEPDGTLVAPDSGYSRPAFPKFAVQKKPSNTLKPRQEAPLPQFQNTPSASGIFSAPRMNAAPVSAPPKRPPFGFIGGLTRKTLPKDREGFEKLAELLKGHGKTIRINSGSQLKSIRANFIKHLGL